MTKPLGHLVFFTVMQNVKVTLSDLTSWFTDLDLDPAYLPNPLQAVDAYRAAATAVKVEYPTPWRHDCQRAVVRLQAVGRDTGAIEHAVTRQLTSFRGVTPKGSTTLQRIGEVIFYRKSVVSSQPKIRIALTYESEVIEQETERPLLEKALRNMLSDYDTRLNFHNAKTIRDLLRGTILHLHAIPMRHAGGVYFVPDSAETDLLIPRLGVLVRRLRDASTFDWLEVPAEPKNKQMVLAHLHAELLGQTRKLMYEVQDLTKVRAENLADLFARYRKISTLATAYVPIVPIPDDAKNMLEEVLELLEAAKRMVKTAEGDSI